MKTSKNLRKLESISAVSLLISKVFLASESIFGWPLAVFGYVLTAIYNFLRRARILAWTVVGLAAMSGFAWYKWTEKMRGLFATDYVILGFTAVFAGGLYFLKLRAVENREELINAHMQGMILITTLSAYLLLGYKILIFGWLSLWCAHILLALFYSRLNARWFTTLQLVSLLIAEVKIINLIFVHYLLVDMI